MPAKSFNALISDASNFVGFIAAALVPVVLVIIIPQLYGGTIYCENIKLNS